MIENLQNSFDVLVIGGGIAGEESALNLANSGFKVLIVEKDLSLGGKMIHLSKVFPTLDCSACITTPKVSETARHPNITIFTYSEVKSIQKETKKNLMLLWSESLGMLSNPLVRDVRNVKKNAL